MNAVDTNILARFLLQDDAEQHHLAVDVLTGGAFVPLTVLMETAWLLGSRYRQPRDAVVAALRTVMSISGVVIEAASHIDWALERFEAGADIADVIHLVAARDLPAFITFDRALVRLAGPDSPVPVETLG
jgi:predicted nucleic-acid-binding protein